MAKMQTFSNLDGRGPPVHLIFSVLGRVHPNPVCSKGVNDGSEDGSLFNLESYRLTKPEFGVICSAI